MQFYFVFPLVLCIVPSRWRLIVAGGVFVCGLYPGVETHPQTRFAGIVVGIALFFVSRNICFERMEPVWLCRSWRSGAFTLALLAILATCNVPDVSFAVASHVAALVGGVLVAAAIYQRGYISPLGVPRILDWIGSRSYSIYLCHIPVMLINRSMVFDFSMHPGGWTAAQRLSDAGLVVQWLGTIAVASELTFRLVERPCQLLARDLALSIDRHFHKQQQIPSIFDAAGTSTT